MLNFFFLSFRSFCGTVKKKTNVLDFSIVQAVVISCCFLVYSTSTHKVWSCNVTKKNNNILFKFYLSKLSMWILIFRLKQLSSVEQNPNVLTSYNLESRSKIGKQQLFSYSFCPRFGQNRQSIQAQNLKCCNIFYYYLPNEVRKTLQATNYV